MGYELYVITDPTLAGGLSHEEIARLAIEGGADAIQLRDKKCDKQDLVATGRHIRKVTRDANVLFVVNDWLDVALSCGADGVHLGQSDLQVREARARAPREFIICDSVSCAADAILAVQQGAHQSRQSCFSYRIKTRCRSRLWHRRNQANKEGSRCPSRGYWRHRAA